MSERAFDILVVGELNPDAIVIADRDDLAFGQVETMVPDGVLTVGSSGAIFACGASRIGLATAFHGVVGDDAGGRFMLGELSRRGVDVGACVTDPDHRTALTVVISRGDDRAILTSPGAMSVLDPASISDELLASAAHLHVTSPSLQPRLRRGLAGLFERAKAAGTGTSLDPGWDPSGEWADGLAPALARTDVFFPNLNEATRFTGAEDPERALELLAETVDTVVIKLGSAGAIAASGEERAGAGSPAVEFLDATGAGDSFAAGFLRARRDGSSLGDSLKLAVAAGSLSTRALGGIDAQPDFEEAASVARNVNQVRDPRGRSGA